MARSFPKWQSFRRVANLGCEEWRSTVSEPLIFVFNMTLQEGKEDDYKAYADELIEFVEKNEPRLISFEVYANDEGTQATNVFVHPDAESEDFHMQVAAEKIKEGYQFVDFARVTIDVYGKPSEAVVQQLREMADSGAPVRVNSRHLGGFIRQST
jgi:hypothetical protein